MVWGTPRAHVNSQVPRGRPHLLTWHPAWPTTDGAGAAPQHLPSPSPSHPSNLAEVWPTEDGPWTHPWGHGPPVALVLC